MKNPVLQEKRQEHVTFQKYALELLELVSGKRKNNGAEIESLANINRVCYTFVKIKNQFSHYKVGHTPVFTNSNLNLIQTVLNI